MNKFVVPANNETVVARLTEMGVPVPGDPPPSPATIARIHDFLSGRLLMVHHTPQAGAWLCNLGDNEMSFFQPIWKP